MVDLTGLAAFGTGVFPGQVQARDARLSLRAKEMDLRARQQDLEADRAIFTALSSGDQPAIPYAQIQQPSPQPPPMAPGQPSVPSAAPAGLSGRAMGPAVGAPGGPPGAPSPSPAAPQGPPVMPAMPQMGGGLNIRDMARRIEQANPGIDKATLFRALVKGQQVLDPESKMAMQYAMQTMRLQAQMDAIDERWRSTQLNADTRTWVTQFVQQALSDRAAAGRATTERGQDIRAGTAERGQDIRSSDAAAARAARDARAGPAKEYNTYSTQLRATTAEIGDLIRENGGMVPAPGTKNWDKYNTLKARRDALFERMVAARKKAEAAGQTVSLSQSETTAEPSSEAPPQDPSSLAEGTTATKGDVTFVVKAGKWVKQ